MARQIAPGSAPEIKAPAYKVPQPSFEALDKLGDAQIKAANTNFKLYANGMLKNESAKLYEQFKNDPIKLTQALSKLPDMVADLPEDIRDEAVYKFALDSSTLIRKAHDNQQKLYDEQNKQMTAAGIEQSRQSISDAYQNVLQNHISAAEDKDRRANTIFLQEKINLNDFSDLKNSEGKNVYTEEQRKKIRDIGDVELEGFKSFFDKMLLNDNDNLESTQRYYKNFILAPDRFMKENFMDRNTYEAARKYAKQELERAGVNIKKARFNQSLRDALALQVENLPEKMQQLKDDGIIDKKILNQIESATAKFDEIDPAKVESPFAMIDMLKIMNGMQDNPAPKNEAEQQAIIEQGAITLDRIAEYGKAYGISPETLRKTRESVVNIESNAAFAPVIRNFSDIISNFEYKNQLVRKKLENKSFSGAMANLFGTGINPEEERKLVQLNQLFAQGMDRMNNQARNGDFNGIKQTQKQIQEGAARINYDWVDWDGYDKGNPQPKQHNGKMVKPVSITFDGDVVFEILK